MRGVKIAFLAACLSVLPCSVSADTFTEFVSGNLADAPGPIGLAPFNHTLGTLTSVEVTINGELIATVQTLPNFSEFGPVPTPFNVLLDQNFSGLPSNSFFTFVDPALIAFTGTGSGFGEAQTLVSPFTYAFQFNSTTDLTGFTPVPGVGLASGNLAGFTDTFSSVMSESLLTTPFDVVGASAVSTSDVGVILVEYDYTPASAPLPEPGTPLLLGAGLAGIAAGLRRRALLSK
jgi:hypothetical protein